MSRGVVSDAYAQLAAEGWLLIAPRSGPRVASSQRANHKGVRPLYVELAEAVRYDLRPGRPDLSRFPRADWLRSMGAAVRGAGDAELDYPPIAGHGAAAGGAGRVPGAGARDARDGRGRARVPGGGAGVHHDRGRAGAGAGGGRGPGARGDSGVAAGARARAGADARGRGRDRGPRAAVQRARDPRHARPPVPDGRRDVGAPARGPAGLGGAAGRDRDRGRLRRRVPLRPRARRRAAGAPARPRVPHRVGVEDARAGAAARVADRAAGLARAAAARAGRARSRAARAGAARAGGLHRARRVRPPHPALRPHVPAPPRRAAGGVGGACRTPP